MTTIICVKQVCFVPTNYYKPVFPQWANTTFLKFEYPDLVNQESF